MSVVGGVRSLRLAKFAMAATFAGWSNDETKALAGVVRNCAIYEKVAAQLREAR